MSRLVLHETTATASSLNGLIDCKVYCITNVLIGSGEIRIEGVELVFQNEKTGKMTNLLITEDGSLSLSDEY